MRILINTLFFLSLRILVITYTTDIAFMYVWQEWAAYIFTEIGTFFLAVAWNYYYHKSLFVFLPLRFFMGAVLYSMNNIHTTNFQEDNI
jgi:hypothetical protein